MRRRSAFFARLLEKQSLRVADPERGKFRSFLLASLDRFLANEHDRATAQKRGGGRAHLSLDLAAGESRVSLEPAHELPPERLYERQWALTLLELVVARLEAEYRETGKARQFELLKDALGGGRDRLPYTEVAAELDISVDNARQAAHRMLKSPAVGLLVGGIVNLLAALTVILLPVVVQLRGGFDEGSGFVEGSATFAEAMFVSIFVALCSVASGIALLIGAARMLDLQSHPIAMFAAFVGMLPVAVALPISLPLGIWALLVLSRQDVKHAFASSHG